MPSRDAQAILDAIRQAAPQGASSYELATISLKYTGRISELRAQLHQQGTAIVAVRGIDGVYRYHEVKEEDAHTRGCAGLFYYVKIGPHGPVLGPFTTEEERNRAAFRHYREYACDPALISWLTLNNSKKRLTCGQLQLELEKGSKK